MLNNEKFDICVIAHGCPPDKEHSTPKENRWMNWLESELKARGFNAVALDLPEPWRPVYEVWKHELEKYQVTEESVLVGHSCGAAFFVRWLLETGNSVKKLILVGPAKVPEKEDDDRNAMYHFELPKDAPKIAEQVVVFTSNDYPHHLKALELYKEALHPRVITLENKQHYLFFQMGTNEFPELLDEVLTTEE